MKLGEIDTSCNLEEYHLWEDVFNNTPVRPICKICYFLRGCMFKYPKYNRCHTDGPLNGRCKPISEDIITEYLLLIENNEPIPEGKYFNGKIHSEPMDGRNENFEVDGHEIVIYAYSGWEILYDKNDNFLGKKCLYWHDPEDKFKPYTVTKLVLKDNV